MHNSGALLLAILFPKSVSFLTPIRSSQEAKVHSPYATRADTGLEDRRPVASQDRNRAPEDSPMKLALGIVAAASITAALAEGPGTTPGQDRTAEAPARHEAVAPEDALHESIRSKFVQDRFLEPSEAAGYPPKAMMGFTSSDRCPDGWEQVRAEDGAPLFHAFGLLVDAGGTRRSGCIRVPACMKRQLRGAPDAGAPGRCGTPGPAGPTRGTPPSAPRSSGTAT